MTHCIRRTTAISRHLLVRGIEAWIRSKPVALSLLTQFVTSVRGTRPVPARQIRGRSATEAGSAGLESALVLLSMMALLFAMLDYPFAIFVQNTLRNSAREGVRFAITQQTRAGGQDAAIKSVVKNNSLGLISDADIASGLTTITVTYVDQSTLAVIAGPGSNRAGSICTVAVSVRRGWMAPIWRSTGLLSFSAASSDVMEAPPGGVLPAR